LAIASAAAPSLFFTFAAFSSADSCFGGEIFSALAAIVAASIFSPSPALTLSAFGSIA